MSKILHFSPPDGADVQETLRAFLHVCRNELTVLGADLNFDQDIWDITDALRIKGKRDHFRLNFTVWGSRRREQGPPMPEPFKSFAKGYIRYQHGLRPSKSISSRLAALRALCLALTESNGAADPTRITPFHFNRAAQIIQERTARSSAYRFGIQLEMIAELMASHRLLQTPTIWRNPIPRPEDTSRVGKEFDERRQSKLPSPTALSALASIFRMASTSADIATTSIAAILCAAPERINEVLRLAIDSQCSETVPSTGEVVYGLRWYPSKDATPQVKWLVRSMEDVVKRAFANLLELSKQARELAEWYTANPTMLYLPEHLEHFRHQGTLSMKELVELLFDEPVSYTVASVWCNTYKVPTIKLGKKRYVYFPDVERAVLGMLPIGFPIADADHGLPYTRALCLTRKNELHPNRATYRCMFMLLGQSDISIRLGSGPMPSQSIFVAHGFAEPDGSPIRITTHQFRHYLNTLAQMGGLSQLDIAKWSGRVRIGQNKAYDHQSNRDIIEMVRLAVGNDAAATGPLSRQNGAGLILRKDFAKLKVPTAHTTEFGHCIHDFAMLPCQVHQDCINCQEHVCIKGDPAKEQRVRILVEETRSLLLAAQEAQRQMYAGAQRWVAHQQRTLMHAEALCAIYDDSSVPDGAVISLNVQQTPSRLVQAVTERQRLIESATNLKGSTAHRLEKS